MTYERFILFLLILVCIAFILCLFCLANAYKEYKTLKLFDDKISEVNKSKDSDLDLTISAEDLERFLDSVSVHTKLPPHNKRVNDRTYGYCEGAESVIEDLEKFLREQGVVYDE